MAGSIKRIIQTSLGKKQDLISKSLASVKPQVQTPVPPSLSNIQ
jgi:hypothetical protein